MPFCTRNVLRTSAGTSLFRMSLPMSEVTTPT